MPYTQEQINGGQRRINFELCDVDTKLIGILKEVVQTLKMAAAAPSATGPLKRMDFSQLDRLLDEASKQSEKVAEIKPPGCEPPPPPPPPPFPN